MKKRPLISLLLLAVTITSCSRNPVTGKNELHFISESTEVDMGEQNYKMMQQAQGGDYTAEKEVPLYVQEVGKKLAAVSDRPDLPYEFVVLNNSVPNAWSLPGGKIAINRGLLIALNSEAELAAVLAHEIVHSAARHSAKAMERAVLMSAGLIGLQQILRGHKYEDVAITGAAVSASLGTLKFSRSAELEADQYGIKYMHAAGYDIEAAVELQKTFLSFSKGKKSNWFSTLLATHPPSEERIKANEQTALRYPKGGFIGKEKYEKRLLPLTKTEEAYTDLDKGYEVLKNGDYPKAHLYAEKGIKIAPQEAHLYNLKGKAELGMKDKPAALASFTKAVELNSNYFDFYLQKGLLERELGNSQTAKQDLEKSLALLPSAEGELALGELYLEEGNTEEAQKHLQSLKQHKDPS